MLILCCGPDTYRAMQRAKELEDAFRTKHDPSGTSIERLESGKNMIDEVIGRSLSVSLFSPMRFIRADGLIENCSKQKTKPLSIALAKDSERVIVVSIEQEKPTKMALKPFESVPKLFVYDYPLLVGKAFVDWVITTGKSLGVHDEVALKRLAESCDGDAWLVANELVKLSVGGVSDVTKEREVKSYEMADAFLASKSDRYRQLAESGLSDRAAYPLLQQAVSALRAHEGDAQTFPPYIISKLKSVSSSTASSVASASLLVTILSRSGLAQPEELTALF